MGGIWGGLFTPTEAGAVGAAGGFLLVVIKRKFTFSGLWQILMDGGRTFASIFLLLICAQMYSRMLTISGLATKISVWATSLPVPPMVIIAGFIVVFLILGCIIDSASIILLTIPIMHPVAVKLGYDPIHFAILSIVAIEIGLLTPPFGMVVFAMKSSLGDTGNNRRNLPGLCSFPVSVIFVSSDNLGRPDPEHLAAVAYVKCRVNGNKFSKSPARPPFRKGGCGDF